MSTLSELHFHNEEAAYARLEGIVWPNGPICPHCGNADVARMTKLAGESTRMGLRACGACRTQFRVTIGTLFEKSKVPLHKWFQAAFLATSKKGISSHQLHRTLDVSYKTAWFMSHRLREAMRNGSLAPMGGLAGTVEADETFIGRKEGSIKRRGHGHKNAVLSLVDRKTKQVRSFHVDSVSAADLVPIVKAHVAKETAMMTDEWSGYFARRPLRESREREAQGG